MVEIFMMTSLICYFDDTCYMRFDSTYGFEGDDFGVHATQDFGDGGWTLPF